MKRVVITGLGAVTPLGHSVTELWDGIRSGKSGVGPITRIDTTDHTTKIAAEVKNFVASEFIDKRDARKMDIFSQYAVAAALEATRDGGLDGVEIDRERAGALLGVGIGGFATIEESYGQLFAKGPQRIPPMTIPKMISNIGPANIAIALQYFGPCYAIATACASGADAIGAAANYIRTGACDVMVAGGVEACITHLGIAGFNVIQALSTQYNDTPEKASRPFDKDRDGFVIGEGAGILLLESLEHAEKRGARIYAELGGYGITNDANHLTQPHPEGRGAIAAMKMALAGAGLEPEQIQYINAHGTSTQINDPIETAAIKAVYGAHARALKVSSTKSMTGHLVGAAGAVEAIISTLAIRDQYVPPTINLDDPDPACDLDYVPHVGVSAAVENVMSNSLGFGGHNGVLVIKKFS